MKPLLMLLCMTLTFVGFTQAKRIIPPAGSVRQVQLTNGTTVTLNHYTTLTVHGKRVYGLTLNGEMLYQTSNRATIISANAFEIFCYRDTKLNVRSFSGDSSISISLYKGKAQLTFLNYSKLLEGKESIDIVFNGVCWNLRNEKNDHELEYDTLWTQESTRPIRTNINAVANDLMRHHKDIKIIVAPEARFLPFQLPCNPSLDNPKDIIEDMAASYGISYVQNGNTFYINRPNPITGRR